MIVQIRAQFRKGKWRVFRRPGNEYRTSDEVIINQALEIGRARLLAEFSSMPESAGIWKLELPKACLDEGEVAMGLAEYLAERCCVEPRQDHEVRAIGPETSIRSVMLALKARGQRVSWVWLWRLWDRAQLTVAALVAVIAWIATLARSIPEPKALVGNADLMLAVHGEWSNRTRHVLALLKESETPIPVIILGRPRIGLNTLTARLAREIGIPSLHLIRPFSIVSAISSFPIGSRLLSQGIGYMSRSRFKPPFSQQVAMLYRGLFGAASAHWWKQGKFQSRVIVYGHTGLADTTQLELAQQSTGALTVHVVHGVSVGLNFVGRSNHAFLPTGHDAAWYQRLGGYGACYAPPLDPPSCSRGPHGWLVLSNLIHPMNRGYRAFGVRDELRLLDEVAKAADAMAVPRNTIVWKPHPVFDSMPASVQTSVMTAIQRLRFQTWNPEWELEIARQFNNVLCTVSTVAIDLLKLGVLPVLVDIQPIDPQATVAQLPLRVNESTAIRDALLAIMDDSDYVRHFDWAWHRIAPARSTEWASIYRATSSS